MQETRSDWTGWRQLFEARADRALPALEADHDYTQLPRSLARSLAVFQLGESGGGTVIRQARQSRLPGVDADYARSLELFVAEENRHANVLAMCVRLLGGKLIRRNWTAKLFVFGRRLMGLRLKILVLLAAEVVGLCFYRLIAERLPPGSLKNWLLDLANDELDHLHLHCEFLRSQMQHPLQRLAFVAAWRGLMFLSGLVVLIDHRRTLRDLDISRNAVRSLWNLYSRDAELLVLAGGNRQPRRGGLGTAGCTP